MATKRKATTKATGNETSDPRRDVGYEMGYAQAVKDLDELTIKRGRVRAIIAIRERAKQLIEQAEAETIALAVEIGPPPREGESSTEQTTA